MGKNNKKITTVQNSKKNKGKCVKYEDNNEYDKEENDDDTKEEEEDEEENDEDNEDNKEENDKDNEEEENDEDNEEEENDEDNEEEEEEEEDNGEEEENEEEEDNGEEKENEEEDNDEKENDGEDEEEENEENDGDSEKKEDEKDELIFMNTEEYCFELDNLKNKKKDKCLKCGIKNRNVYNLAVCKSCLWQLSIMKTAAMKLYNLKKADMVNLDCYAHKNSYRGYTHLYFIKEIRLVAIKKRFNIDNPTRQQYINCLGILGDEYLERKNKTRLRRQKILDAKRIKLEQREKLCEKIDRELMRQGMTTISKLSKYYDQYVDGYIGLDEAISQIKRDLLEKIKLAKEKKNRRKMLSKALEKRGLVIRDDSVYCSGYIDEDKYTLDKVVRMMVIMDFFATKTDYFKLLSQIRDEYYQENKYLGYYERIYIDESDKQACKIKALEKYLESHPNNSVPTEVMDKYQKHILPKNPTPTPIAKSRKIITKSRKITAKSRKISQNNSKISQNNSKKN